MLCQLDKLGDLSYVNALFGTVMSFGLFERCGSMSQQDGPVRKGACCHSWCPEFNPQIHLMKEENWLLQGIFWPPQVFHGPYVYTCTHTYMHTYTIHKRQWAGVPMLESAQMLLAPPPPKKPVLRWALLGLTSGLSLFAVQCRTPRKLITAVTTAVCATPIP